MVGSGESLKEAAERNGAGLKRKKCKLSTALCQYYKYLFKPLEPSEFRLKFAIDKPGPYDDCPDPTNVAESKAKKYADAKSVA